MSYVQPAAAGRRTVGIVIVVLFHALLFYALVTGLARKVVEVIKAPLETKIIEEVKPPDDKPPPPPPKLAPPPPAFIPPPEVTVQAPAVQTEATITTVTQTKPTEPAPPQPVAKPVAAPQPANNHAAVIDSAKHCTLPDYPAASQRAEETGTVRLLFLIDVDGRALESRVEKSSGYRRLDEAARKALMNCRFKAAIVNGEPAQAWGRLDYEWKLEE